MVIKDTSANKSSPSPELTASLERYKTLGKKKRGRPKKVSTALHPDLRVAMPSLLLNPHIDKDLFWDVFYAAASKEGRGDLRAKFDRWQQLTDRAKRQAKQLSDLAIKLTEEVQSEEADLRQMKHLANAIVDSLPKEQLAEFFHQVAKRKAEGGHWRKKLQLRMGCEYSHQGGFYGALSKWIKDEYGINYSADAVRKYVQREFKKLQQE